ncbi:MAG: prepilin-type N-terminal cleavage/methylation domain-containing protein [Patescibacteria group bacterium]|nr:prepilin-type N-terminal cleavage/methylation domain-containing protein [Patescibacteria group bacterium]
MNKKGFTLIELLVVIAIIGVLSTLAVVALGSARQKANDAKRLSDIKQVQTALELYYTDNNHYPTSTAAVALGDTAAACLNNSDLGWAAAGCATPYMGLVPKGPGTNEFYQYTSTGTGTTYTITATLEVGAGGFGLGAITASESGMNQ